MDGLNIKDIVLPQVYAEVCGVHVGDLGLICDKEFVPLAKYRERYPDEEPGTIFRVSRIAEPIWMD